GLCLHGEARLDLAVLRRGCSEPPNRIHSRSTGGETPERNGVGDRELSALPGLPGRSTPAGIDARGRAAIRQRAVAGFSVPGGVSGSARAGHTAVRSGCPWYGDAELEFRLGPAGQDPARSRAPRLQAHGSPDSVRELRSISSERELLPEFPAVAQTLFRRSGCRSIQPSGSG